MIIFVMYEMKRLGENWKVFKVSKDVERNICSFEARKKYLLLTKAHNML